MSMLARGASAAALPGLSELLNGRWARVTRMAIVALTLLALYTAVSAATPWGYDFGTGAYYVPAVLGLAFSVGPIRRSRGIERIGWLSLAAAIAALASGDGMYSYYRLALDRNAPFPGIADAFFYAGYVALIGAMALLTFPRWRLKDRRWLIEAAIVMVAAGTLSWQFVIAPTTAAHDQSYWHAAVGLGYPLLDLAIVTAIVLTVYFSAGPLGPRAFVLGTTGVVWFVTDSVWGYLVTTGNYSGGTPAWVSICFMTGHWLMAACFVLPPDSSRLVPPSPVVDSRAHTNLLLAYLAVLSLAVAAFVSALRGDAAPVLTGGAILTMGLTLMGYVVLRRGNLALVQQFQHEYAYRHALMRGAEQLGEASGVISGGRLVDVNERACSLLGYRRNQLLTLTDLSSLFAPEDRDRAMKSIEAAISEGDSERRLRVEAVKRDGRRISLDIAIASFAVTDGRRLLFLARPAELPASVAIPSSPLDVEDGVVGAGGPVRPLSPRELEIVGLIARGYSNQDIADQLEISLKTVEVHTVNIRKKLPVHNRVQLVRYAFQHGLVSTGDEPGGSSRKRSQG